MQNGPRSISAEIAEIVGQVQEAENLPYEDEIRHDHAAQSA